MAIPSGWITERANTPPFADDGQQVVRKIRKVGDKMGVRVTG